jgi:hypothetical protein
MTRVFQDLSGNNLETLREIVNQLNNQVMFARFDRLEDGVYAALSGDHEGMADALNGFLEMSRFHIDEECVGPQLGDEELAEEYGVEPNTWAEVEGGDWSNDDE